MSQSPEQLFASHVLATIRKDVEFLMQQSYISHDACSDILRLLPQQAVKRVSAEDGAQANDASAPATRQHAPPAYQESSKQNNTLGTAEALYDFTGQNSQGLSFRQGDIIQITEYVNQDWWRGTLNGNSGLFPSNYVKKRSPTRDEKRAPPTPPARAQPVTQHQMPPPQAASYGGGYPPAPAQAPAVGYGAPPAMYPAQPPSMAAPAPQYNYAAPPPVVVASAPAGGEQQSSGLSGILKNTAANIGSAATWGFGATLGSEAAQSLF